MKTSSDAGERCGCDQEPCVCEIRPEDVRAFEKIARRFVAQMETLLSRVRAYCPGAEISLMDMAFVLATGPLACGVSGEMRQDRVRASISVPMDGGGW